MSPVTPALTPAERSSDGPARTHPLTADEVVAAAAAVIAEQGLEAFSMRRLAAEVGVTPMALYQRFENRQALLDAVAAAALADLEVPVPAAGTWDDRLVAWATGVRHHLVALGDLLTVVGGSERLAAAMLRASDQALGLMTELGYDDAAAVAAFRSVFWHAVGSALARTSMTTRAPEALRLALGDVPGDDLPNFVDLLGHFGALDPDELFEHSTRLLAAGLRAGAPSPPGASP